MTEVLWFTALIGALCGLAGYFIGHEGGAIKWFGMYVDEQNKRIKAENEMAEIMRSPEYQRLKLLERFEAETA